jgi:plasmid stability protein
MAQVLVRDLDDDIVRRLKVMARRENVSLEQKFRDMAGREVRAAEERFEAVAAP